MSERVKIYCINTRNVIEVEGGECLKSVYDNLMLETTLPAVVARVNNKSESLDYRVYNNCDVEFVGVDDPSGFRAYERSLCFVLYKAVSELYPGVELRVEHSVANGKYCTLAGGSFVPSPQ